VACTLGSATAAWPVHRAPPPRLGPVHWAPPPRLGPVHWAPPPRLGLYIGLRGLACTLGSTTPRLGLCTRLRHRAAWPVHWAPPHRGLGRYTAARADTRVKLTRRAESTFHSQRVSRHFLFPITTSHAYFVSVSEAIMSLSKGTDVTLTSSDVDSVV